MEPFTSPCNLVPPLRALGTERETSSLSSDFANAECDFDSIDLEQLISCARDVLLCQQEILEDV